MNHRAGRALIALVAGMLALAGCLREFRADQPDPVAGTVVKPLTQSPDVSGTAAVGAPITGANVNAICADESPKTAVLTQLDGSFRLTLPSDLAGPCVLKVSEGFVGGGGSPHVLYGFATAPGTGNVTPLTELVLARAAGAVPSSIYNARTLNDDVLNAIDENTAAADAYVQDQLLRAGGFTIPAGPFFNTPFVIGDAMDQLLDQLGARMRAANVTQAQLSTVAAAGGNFFNLIPPLAGGPQQFSDPLWGTVTISGTGLPTAVLTSFTPNDTPDVRASGATWRRISLAGPNVVTNQSLSVNFVNNVLSSISLVAGTVKASVACPSAACDLLVHDQNTLTMAFKDLPITIGTVEAKLNGLLRYTGYPAQAGTTISNSNFVNCTRATIPAIAIGTFATVMSCTAGVYKGTSDYGTLCSMTVDTTAGTMRMIADNLDQTVTFGAVTNTGGRTTNLSQTFSDGILTYQMFGPFPFSGGAWRSIALNIKDPVSDDLPLNYTVIDIVGEVRNGGANGDFSQRKRCQLRIPPLPPGSTGGG